MAEELSGTMVERVAIEQFVDARDANAASVGSWVAAGSRWAAIIPDGSGSTQGVSTLGEARRSRRRWRVTLRPGGEVGVIGLTSRLIWRGEWLAVIAIESDPRRPDRMVLRCEMRGT